MKTSICDLTLYNEHKPLLESQFLHGEPCALTSLSELVLLTFATVGAVPGGLDKVTVPQKRPKEYLRFSEAPFTSLLPSQSTAAGHPLQFILVGPDKQALLSTLGALLPQNTSKLLSATPNQLHYKAAVSEVFLHLNL